MILKFNQGRGPVFTFLNEHHLVRGIWTSYKGLQCVFKTSRQEWPQRHRSRSFWPGLGGKELGEARAKRNKNPTAAPGWMVSQTELVPLQSVLENTRLGVNPGFPWSTLGFPVSNQTHPPRWFLGLSMGSSLPETRRVAQRVCVH